MKSRAIANRFPGTSSMSVAGAFGGPREAPGPLAVSLPRSGCLALELSGGFRVSCRIAGDGGGGAMNDRRREVRRRWLGAVLLGSTAALLIPGPAASVVPADGRPAEGMVRELGTTLVQPVQPPGTTIWDVHRDALGDAWPADYEGVPELTAASMAIFADDPATSWDETNVLTFLALTDSRTSYVDCFEVFLDSTGDTADDFGFVSCAEEARYPVVVYRIVDGIWEETGGRAWAVKWANGFGAAVVNPGLSVVRFKVRGYSHTLAKEQLGWSDFAPDDYTGSLVALPQGGGLATPIPEALLGRLSPPLPPTSFTAVPGDGSVSLSWAPSDAGASPVTGYEVTTSPQGSPGLNPDWHFDVAGPSIAVNGLANQRGYVFSVVAVSASGRSTPVSVGPVVPRPFVTVRVKAKKKASVLYIDIDPNLENRRYWTFLLQRQASDGSWITLRRVYRSAGSKERRTIDVKKGTYRVVVLAKYGYQQTVSAGTARLKR